MKRYLVLAALLAGCASSPPADQHRAISGPPLPAPAASPLEVRAALELPPRVMPERAARSRPAPRPSRSAAARRAPVVRTPRGFEAWARSAKARAVIWCESRDNPRAVSRTGKYRGLLQMDADFWRTYGGLRFASRPDAATRRQQLLVGYRGYLARGWQPWSCA